MQGLGLGAAVERPAVQLTFDRGKSKTSFSVLVTPSIFRVQISGPHERLRRSVEEPVRGRG